MRKRGYGFWDNTGVPATRSGAPSVGGSLFQAGRARRTLLGFLLSGLLFSFLGAALPVWRYHLAEDFHIIGLFFLAMSGGMLLGLPVARVLPKKNLAAVLSVACGIACAALLYLAALSPGAPDWSRMAGVAGLGCGAALLNTALFRALTPVYAQNATATLYLSGTFFGLGCVLTTVLVAGTFNLYTVPSILILLAAFPGYGIGIYARSRLAAEDRTSQPSLVQALNDFRSPAAVLLALLLFLQFGNEWAVAGWLPIYLIRRIGVSPEGSLILLALYWLALLVGRIVVLSILPLVVHGRLLGASLLAAVFGCLILAATNNRFGATAGILLLGAGFASVYPLVAEKIGTRFPYYHPGFFNGIFSFALMGAMLAPWSLSMFADVWGIQVVMLFPAFGTLLVFLLVVVIWAEAKFSSQVVRKSAG